MPANGLHTMLRDVTATGPVSEPANHVVRFPAICFSKARKQEETALKDVLQSTQPYLNALPSYHPLSSHSFAEGAERGRVTLLLAGYAGVTAAQRL